MLILDSPKYLTLKNFKSQMYRYGGPAKSCRYVVSIVPVGSLLQPYGTFMQDLTYLCEIAEFPGRAFTNMDVRYYGPNQKLPFQTTYEDINLTFICRGYSREREFFDDWMNIVNPNNTWDFRYRDEYVARVNVFQLVDYNFDDGDSGMATYKLTMHNAYPLLLNPQPVTWQDDQFQRIQVNLTYTHWTRPTDPEIEDYSLVRGRNVTRIA